MAPTRGRPRLKGAPGYVRHRTRPWRDQAHPLHVTWKFVAGLGTLRRRKVAIAIGRALRKNMAGNLARKTGFRVVQFSVQPDHLHLLVEAGSKARLTAGLRGLGVWVVRTVNAELGRRGRALRERYHARALATPREVRHALVYILQNHRHHRPSANLVDECSSALWFDGWAAALPQKASRASPLPAAQTWLATKGWRRHGRIRFDEVPKN